MSRSGWRDAGKVVEMDASDFALDDLVRDNTAAKRLLGQVRTFFGPGFNAQLIPGSTSLFKFDVWEPPPSATILLAQDSSRMIEALVHELFHLWLPTCGYPILYNFEHAADYQPQTLAGAINEVQHLIFIRHYLSAGFDLDKFLANPAKVGYAPAPPANRGDALRFVQQDYFGLKVALALGYSNASYDLVSFRRAADESGQPISTMTDALDAWFQKREYADQNSYTRSIAELIAILKLPLTSLQFCTLEGRDGASPTVILQEVIRV